MILQQEKADDFASGDKNNNIRMRMSSLTPEVFLRASINNVPGGNEVNVQMSSLTPELLTLKQQDRLIPQLHDLGVSDDRFFCCRR